MEFSQKMLEHIRAAQHIVIFTGAGVSQESGIPTFRDTMTGLWERFSPEQIATRKAFNSHPELVWGWYEWRRSNVLRCQPNAAHEAIAAMEKRWPKVTVITQNVDDLHERAGSTNVIHLHGSLHHPYCCACGEPYNFSAGIPDAPDDGRSIAPPRCQKCGRNVRPGVVWFGEDLPTIEWSRARNSLKTCDVFFSVGTSSLVQPAATLPVTAASLGACIIQINPLPTQHDNLVKYNLRGKAGETFSLMRWALDI